MKRQIKFAAGPKWSLPGLDDDSSPEHVAEEWRQAAERDADADDLRGWRPSFKLLLHQGLTAD